MKKEAKISHFYTPVPLCSIACISRFAYDGVRGGVLPVPSSPAWQAVAAQAAGGRRQQARVRTSRHLRGRFTRTRSAPACAKTVTLASLLQSGVCQRVCDKMQETRSGRVHSITHRWLAAAIMPRAKPLRATQMSRPRRAKLPGRATTARVTATPGTMMSGPADRRADLRARAANTRCRPCFPVSGTGSSSAHHSRHLATLQHGTRKGPLVSRPMASGGLQDLPQGLATHAEGVSCRDRPPYWAACAALGCPARSSLLRSAGARALQAASANSKPRPLRPTETCPVCAQGAMAADAQGRIGLWQGLAPYTLPQPAKPRGLCMLGATAACAQSRGGLQRGGEGCSRSTNGPGARTRGCRAMGAERAGQRGHSHRRCRRRTSWPSSMQRWATPN